MTTADKMPLMLDSTMAVDINGVDDLFGDDPLALQPAIQGKQLFQRLDELRSRGCYQTVAWSRGGTIASIRPDGLSLEFRALSCHPDNGSWGLSGKTTTDVVKGTPTNPLVHLEWSTTNIPELAVIDSVGRVTLMNFSISLNHPFVSRQWDGDSVDDVNTVVGCHWLPVAPSNQQRPFNVLYGPAVKQGHGYQYESAFVHASGPHHPHNAKSALFCVTMSGMLKMYWSQNNNRMEETVIELESVSSTNDLVTHASLASDKKYLIIALTTAAKKLKIVKIEIQWAGPGAVQEKTQLPQTARLNPSLVENYVATIDWLQNVDDQSMTELSNLLALPSIMDNTGKSTAPPLILGLRSRAPGGESFQMAQTIIDRWECIEQRQNLQNAFEQIGSRRNSVSTEIPPSSRLKRLDPVVINKVAIGCHAIQFGKVLLLTMSDGSVEYRDRFTFEELYGAEDTEKVMNLKQVGWTFSEEGPCQQVALSPTCCSFILLGDDGKLRWSRLKRLAGDIGDSMQDANYSASVAGLTMAAASAIWYQINFDDLLAIGSTLVEKKKFTQDWISELVRILKIQVDYSEELHHDSLMRNSPLQACLSIMNSLGFKGELQPRTFQSKFAYIDLNVRIVVILITLASNTPMSVREKMHPLDEPEVVDALAGCAKWSLDLLAWITDSLFELMGDEKFQELLVPQKFVEMTAYLHERNDIALHLLLCSCSRSFLSALCRRIAHLDSVSTKANDFYRRQAAQAEQSGTAKLPSSQLQQAYQRMQQVTGSSLIKAAEFEKLLNVLGADIKATYVAFLPNLVKQGSNPPQGKQIDMAMKAAQVQLELFMLLAKSPPPAFLSVIKKLFARDLKAFRAHTDPANLFFADFAPLGVQDDKRSLEARAAKGGAYYDVFKRVELRAGTGKQWRRCVRCASVMEDVFGNKPGYTFVLGQQRKCSCGGHWALLQKDKLVL